MSVGAGTTVDISPFMHPVDTKAQPTTNNSFSAFHKARLVSLVYGKARKLNQISVFVENMRDNSIGEIKCEVMLKCDGWSYPGRIVQEIYPKFK